MKITNTQKLMAITTLLSAVIVVGTTVRAQLDTMEDPMGLPMAPMGEPMFTEEMEDTESMAIPSMPMADEGSQEEMLPEEIDEPRDAEIGSAEVMESNFEETSFPAAPESEADVVVEEETSNNPFGSKTFYRGGERAEVREDETSSTPAQFPAAGEEPVDELPVVESSSSAMSEEVASSSEASSEMAAPVVEDSGSSIVSMILGSGMYILAAVVLVAGGAFYLVLGRKKKLVAGSNAPSPQIIAQAAESASPRLAEALKAMQAEEGIPSVEPTIDEVIPQEETSGPSGGATGQ